MIVFSEYEIATGAAGKIQFEIVGNAEIYEDNFAVDAEATKKFANKVKASVRDKNLEALAEMTAFLVYVGLPGVNVIETKGDFLKIGKDALFTDQLLKSVEKASIDSFQPSMAGFTVTDGSMASITFGVADGRLAIQGINY
ncbi:hypothetical protein IMSAG049_00149 [Clostridiales bacterium]|nr:hypothetical protein IMSAG049_00149 [Clostridiales bacterium]